MGIITKATGRLVCIIWFMLMAVTAVAQETHVPSPQLKNFNNALAQVGMTFNQPDGFKEAKVVNTPALPFEYALEIPDADFEIWFRINTQKDNERFLSERDIDLSSDSAYVAIANEQLKAFTTDDALVRNIPTYMLDRYNADAGRTYLINLNDAVLTKHYKYALLIVLQKNKTGTLMAVCFTNVKGPEFFKNMYKASNCVKFKP